MLSPPNDQATDPRPMKCLSACLLLLLATPFAALAADAPPRAAAAAPKADPRAELARRIPGSKAEDFRPSPVPGLYELAQGAEIVYVTSDGKYAFAGDLYDLNDDTNLSERRRRDSRLALISGVPEAQMLVFSPKDPKYTITVFTDIDCGYCRKLHGEMAKYNELGIRVRYLFYPRTGPATESWDKAVSVWCSPNRNDSFTRAKRGEMIRAAKCGSSPVERDFELGQEMGLRGTPAILLSNGDMVPGYVAPAALAKRLETLGR
jgi:thiol:disulfide interchange protein DsbC